MIRVSFELSRKEHSELSSVISRVANGNDWFRPLRVAAYAAAAIGFVLIVAQPSATVWLAPTALIVLSLTMLVYPTWYAYGQVDKQWNRAKERENTVTAEIASDGVSLSGPRSRTWLKWNALHRVVETRSFFLFCSADDEVLLWIPKRCLGDSEASNTLRQLIDQKLPPRARGFPVKHGDETRLPRN